MKGKGVFAFSIIVAVSFSASFVDASDSPSGKEQQAGSSSWMQPLKKYLTWTGCLLACRLADYPLICVFHHLEYNTWSKMQFACFEDLCDYLIPDAEVIYEDGSCASKIGKIKVAEHIKSRRNPLKPEPREKPVFTGQSNKKL